MAADDSEIDRASWPLQSSLELAAQPAAVPLARSHTRQVLAKWDVDGLTDPAELIVSELVTNAIRSATTSVTLGLASDRRRIQIRVRDDDPDRPALSRAEPDAEGGRGLLLVACLSVAWGTVDLSGGSSKAVWAIVETAEPTPPGIGERAVPLRPRDPQLDRES